MTAAVLSARFDTAPPVFGLLGDGRVHLSRRPVMYSRILAHVGLGGACVPLRVAPDDLGNAVASIRILHLAGAEVGAPYRQLAAGYLDVLSEGANIIGAVNTIVRLDDKLKGYNTDAIGIMDTLEARGFAVAGSRAIVFGTGGAARAAVFILTWLRAEHVWIAGRNPESARRMADALGGSVLPLENLPAAVSRADLVINATSVSSADEDPELAQAVATLPLEHCRLVLDLNFDRRDNFWQTAAKACGCPFADGLQTMAFQARRSFFLWTRMEVPPEEFLAALRH